MKIVFFFTGIFLCLISCKTQDYVSDNTNYSTPPEIGGVTTDLPRKSAYMHITGVENTKENNSLSNHTDNIEMNSPSNQKNKNEISLPSSSKKDTIIFPKKEISDIPATTVQKEISADISTTVKEKNAIPDKQNDKPLVKSPKPIENSEKDLPKDKVTDSGNSSVRNLNVSDFSWEVGIKITQILDVRTLKEFKTGHIYDAINMDVNDPSFVNQIQTLDKTSPVAVYSQYGKRSIKAIRILKQYGFEIIYNLNGGLEQWIKEKKEIFR